MILLCLILLTVPLEKLFRMYVHVVSLLLFGLAHFLSVRYVVLEREDSDPDLKLDDFTKLERHGFYFIAQVGFIVDIRNYTTSLALNCLSSIRHVVY